MNVTLAIETGDDAGRVINVAAGPPTRVGRDAPCEVRVRGDSMISNPHFTVEVVGEAARLRDLGSRFGTMVNGIRVNTCDLKDGDKIRAGKTEFTVRLKSDVTAPPPTNASTAPAATATTPPTSLGADGRILIDLLRAEPNLYALLDAARDRTIPYRLTEAQVPHESLYEGNKGLEIAHVGPWLARLEGDAPLLQTLVTEGWGRSWGVYLSCDQPLKDVRHHLRRFMIVQLPEKKSAYFRYYDPRVLRVYLPTCDAGERETFFGPIGAYLCESHAGYELLRFRRDQAEPLRLTIHEG